MTSHRAVVLIRGINVGANRKVPMADLRSLCDEAGCSEVQTYIQSGNVVLSTTLSDAKLAETLAAGLEDRFGFRPSVMIRRPKELRRVIDAQPFSDDATASLHVGFLGGRPTAAALASLEGVDHEPEQFVVQGREMVLHLPLGVGRSPLMQKVPFERRLGVDVTMRNWRTVTKLAELSGA